MRIPVAVLFVAGLNAGAPSTVSATPSESAGSVSAANVSTADWQEFRHSSGATLTHPPDWRLVEQANGVNVQPPNPATNEMIIATGMAASGATDPGAPDVANYLDASLLQMFPGLRRTGAPVPVTAAEAKGALYRYEGTLGDGSEVASHVYVTIQNGIALSLSAMAPPDRLDSRAPTLEKIFASMTAAAPAATAGGSTPTGDDARLVGMFAGESLAGGGSDVYVNTQLVYVLNRDGTLYYGAQSHFSASERDYNGDLVWTASGNSGGNVERGRWSAGNGFLTIRWDSGQQSYFAYGFEPDGSLVLRDPRTRKLINFYSRVR